MVALGLVAVVAAVYAPVSGYTFVNWDDPEYVSGNLMIRGGLSWAAAGWAFTSMHAANWHPLTWLSHMLDVQLFGMAPGGHHVTSVVLHAVSSVLLFAWLQWTTRATGASAFVAALFALHPVHVESVAWISERKDVLSTFFLMLTLFAYAAYVRAPSLVRYAAVVAAFAAGLMAKPMLVTLPALLLLLDFWPLQRVRLGSFDRSARATWLRLIVEKAPLFALSLASAVITVIAQSSGGAVARLEAFPFGLRVGNALVSYVSYLGKMLWPVRLAVVYPYRQHPWPWMAAAALIALVGLTALAVRTARRHPYVLVGWLWYLVTLVPVIGLVQVGSQSMADRYTYVPLIGLFVVVAWGVPALLARAFPAQVAGASPLRRACSIGAVAVIALCAVAARLQLRHWRDDLALWGHTIEVTEDNPRAHNNLANALSDRGRTDEAISHYREAIRIQPGFAEAHGNLGNSLASSGQVGEAIAEYREALRLDPNNVFAHNGLGSALDEQGALDEAVQHYREALRLDPGSPEAHNNLGAAFVKQGKSEEAVREFLEAIRFDPASPYYHFNVALVLEGQGDGVEARRHLEEALALDASFQPAREALNALAPRE